MASREEIALCEADALRREAERVERDTPKPRKGKRPAFVPTPLSAFTFRGGSSFNDSVEVHRSLSGRPTGHVLVYRRPEPGVPYRYAFTR